MTGYAFAILYVGFSGSRNRVPFAVFYVQGWYPVQDASSNEGYDAVFCPPPQQFERFEANTVHSRSFLDELSEQSFADFACAYTCSGVWELDNFLNNRLRWKGLRREDFLLLLGSRRYPVRLTILSADFNRQHLKRIQKDSFIFSSARERINDLIMIHRSNS